MLIGLQMVKSFSAGNSEMPAHLKGNLTCRGPQANRALPERDGLSADGVRTGLLPACECCDTVPCGFGLSSAAWIVSNDGRSLLSSRVSVVRPVSIAGYMQAPSVLVSLPPQPV